MPATAPLGQPSFPQCLYALENFQPQSPFVATLHRDLVRARLMLLAEPFMADQNYILMRTITKLCEISCACDAHVKRGASSAEEVDLVLEVREQIDAIAYDLSSPTTTKTAALDLYLTGKVVS